MGRRAEDDAKRLFINRTRRGWQKREPLDDKLRVERPELLQNCFQLWRDEGRVAKGDVLEALSMAPSYIEELIGLEKGFFSGDKAEIISIPKFKQPDATKAQGAARIIPFLSD